MTAISIGRASLALGDLTFDDSNAGDWTIMPGFSWGERLRENEIAESPDLPGGFLIRSRTLMTGMPFTIRANTTSLDDFLPLLDELDTALGQFTYTVDVVEGSTGTTYDAMPGNWQRMFHRDEMRAGRDRVTVYIPRQP